MLLKFSMDFRILFLIVFVLNANVLFARDTTLFRGFLVPYTSLFIAGSCEGFREVITHHYYKFSAVFPNANPQYWNPATSWTNKGGNVFRRTIAVGTTDAYHLSNTLRNGFALAFICTLDRPKGWKRVLSTVIISTACYNAGKHLVWSVLF